LPLLYVGSAFVFMILAVPFGHLADRAGRERVLVAGYALLAVLYGLLLAARPSWPGLLLVVACMRLLGVWYAATGGVLMALASPMLPREVRTSGLAVVTTCTTVARLLASVMFGAAWTWWGLDRALLVWLVGLVVATAASALAWAGQSQEERA